MVPCSAGPAGPLAASPAVTTKASAHRGVCVWCFTSVAAVVVVATVVVVVARRNCCFDESAMPMLMSDAVALLPTMMIQLMGKEIYTQKVRCGEVAVRWR